MNFRKVSRHSNRAWAVFPCAFLAAVLSAPLDAAVLAFNMRGTGQLYSFDLTTGSSSTIGSANSTFSNGATVGIGEANGALFDALTNDDLYIIDVTTGNSSLIGSDGGSFAYLDFGSTDVGLFAIGQDDALYSIDPSTGIATNVGPTGLAGLCSNVSGCSGLSTGSSTLYFSDGTGNLYTIDTTSGAATLIGTMGANIGSMVFQNGTLYGVASTNVGGGGIYSIDTSTGAATFTSHSTGFAYNNLAPDPIVTPEPTSLSLLGAAVLLGVLRMTRRSRRISGSFSS